MTFDSIPGVLQIRRFIEDFRPDGLRRWRFFHLDSSHSNNKSYHQLMDLTIQAEYSGEPDLGYVIELQLQGVRELRLPELRGWFGFDAYVIEDVRANQWANQWEGVGYRVAECEEGRRFLVLCRSIAFTKLILAQRGCPDQVIWDATVPAFGVFDH